MKYSKYLIISILICFSFVNWACDNRVPDDSQSSTNSTIEVTEIQAIADEGGERVGEVVSGYSSMRIVATLKNESGQAFKDQTISFSHNGQGGDFSNGVNVITDENGQVINVFKPNSSEQKVDATTTPDFEGLVVTLTYGTSPTAKVEFNVYQEKEDVWPYTINVSSDVDNIKLDNGVTTAQITAQLFNKTNTPLHNVILLFNSNKGYIESEGTTDSTGSVTMTFQDNGDQEDIGLANIVCSFEHPAFSATVSDSAQVTIGTDNGLTLQIFPVTYDETGSTAIVGEDISGSVSYTLLIATVTDTSGNVISGIPITFTATSSNVSVGSITYANVLSNTNGQVVAEFDDGGNVYKDNPGTPNYEGVTIFAKFGDKTTDPENFNVYAADDVWPYNLFATTDTDVISLDGGETTAWIVSRLLNKLGNPVNNAQINYTASLGFIAATGFTDSVGVDSVSFTDLGNPEDVGVSDIMSTFSHPGFDGVLIQDSLQVYIEDPSFQSCAFMEIPSSIPGNIVVRDGGGLESTFIRAEVYDDNGTLINTPTPVVFTMEPLLGDAYLETPGQTSATIYTVNGIASVSINSGTTPGPVRIVATCDCNPNEEPLTVIDVPVIIASGAPYHIEAEYDPFSTEPIAGGLYQAECAAVVSDIHYNPVEDTTYVYWGLLPTLPDTIIDAVVEGVSFTNNEGILSGEATSGVARSNIIYSRSAIGDMASVVALTFGGDNNGDGISGDSVLTYIQYNEDENQGDAPLYFVPGEVSLMASAEYWDFTLNGNPALIQITVIVTDYYNLPVVDVPIAFGGTGVSNYYEVQYENAEYYVDQNGSGSYDFGEPFSDADNNGVWTGWEDEGVNGVGVGDGCFSWRDYGQDDDPSTLDWGNYNDNHDSFDTTGNGEWDSQEISEFFNDWGLDGMPNTSDEGEGNGKWDGYSMIGCEPIVKTDEDGFARIIVEFDQGICTLANVDDDGDCTYDDFTASISATLLIPEITTSEPLDILLVRTGTDCD
jgi:hypothetical protein